VAKISHARRYFLDVDPQPSGSRQQRGADPVKLPAGSSHNLPDDYGNASAQVSRALTVFCSSTNGLPGERGSRGFLRNPNCPRSPPAAFPCLSPASRREGPTMTPE